MLTKKDLQQIKGAVQEEIKPIKQDVGALQTSFKKTEKNIKTIKSDITKIRASQNEIIRFFEKEYLDLRQRVERIEEHLNLPPIPKLSD